MSNILRDGFVRVRDGLAWRIHGVLGDRVVYGSLLKIAQAWRTLIRKPIYVGVTGSAGKTTTKELLCGMLSRTHQGRGNVSSYNNIEEIAKAVLQLRPSHGFFVSEISGHRPNEMDRPLEFLRPSIGIVTVVKNDHRSAFNNSPQAIAEEKGKLVACLPPWGTAVLNADEELVLAMAERTRAKIITYGMSEKAQLRAVNVSSLWPRRLEFDLIYGAERIRVSTQLCGTHWVPSVLGAIGGGLAFGLTLSECAECIAGVPPFDGRMQPVTTAEGITFIRDEFKAPLWTVQACLDFMHAAQAKRKIIVIGMISDGGPESANMYVKLAQRAQSIADITVFVGPWASHVLKTRKPGAQDALRVFSHVREASQYINSVASAGDLVLLKGTTKQDHLLRIILARTSEVACWRDDCQRVKFCNECSELTKASGMPTLQRDIDATSDLSAADALEHIIIGLGNPQPQYAETPHNVGYAMADHIACTLGLEWKAYSDAWIARGIARGRAICLVKMRVEINHTGAALQHLAKRLSFRPAQCILLYDDLDTALGAVRARLNGGAAGHKGVASILEAFQTDEFRRVKIGVKPSDSKRNRIEYVLSPFDPVHRPAIDQAISIACDRTLALTTGT